MPRARLGLVGALIDEDWQVRKLAAEALGLLRDDRAVPGLLGALHDDNLWVRYGAAHALGDLGDLGTVGALLETLGEHYHFLKYDPFGSLVTRLHPEPADTLHRPSADVLFHSIADSCAAETCAVILTGMGEDGALGMRALYERGGGRPWRRTKPLR